MVQADLNDRLQRDIQVIINIFRLIQLKPILDLLRRVEIIN
jgi:hypothetical protein